MLGLDGVASSAEMKGSIVPTGMGGGGATGGSGGSLSPNKLIEMSEQFATSTAAMSDVDLDGAGQAEAARELANLLLAPEGSTLQVRGVHGSWSRRDGSWWCRR